MQKRVAAMLGAFVAMMATSSHATIAYAPIVFRQDSGTRPFVIAELNGKHFLMMVHANAVMYLMTTHTNAAAIGAFGVATGSQYGITATGHVSNLGMSKAVLSTLSVAGHAVKNVPLEVFEIPQNPPTDGMIGIQWLRDQKVIVDYDEGRIGVPDTLADAQAEDKRLIAKGYIPHKMHWDPKSSNYKINGAFSGQPIVFSVSTVAQNIIDSETAERFHVKLGAVVDEAGGPEGGVTPVRVVKSPQPISVDGQVVHEVQPWSFSIDDYHAEKDTSKDGFTLGADFMLANQAIIDFGTETLLLAPAK